jgi:TPR repeat protein
MRKWIARLVAVALLASLAFCFERLRLYKREAPLREGLGAFKSDNYSLAWARLEPLAREGNPVAQRALAMMYARGWGRPVDEERATMWLRRAECGCESPGRGELDLALDMSSYVATSSSDRAMAVHWLQRAAEAGHPDAQRLLADSSALKARGLSVDSSISQHWRHPPLP